MTGQAVVQMFSPERTVKQIKQNVAKGNIALGDGISDAEAFYKKAGGDLLALKNERPADKTWGQHLKDLEVGFGARRADKLIALYEGKTTLAAQLELNRVNNENYRNRKRLKRESRDSNGHDGDDVDDTDEGDGELTPDQRRVGVMLQVSAARDLARGMRNRINLNTEVFRKSWLQEFAVEARATAVMWDELARELEEKFA